MTADRQHLRSGPSAGRDGKKWGCRSLSRSLPGRAHDQDPRRRRAGAPDKRLYRERNLIELSFSKLKHFRRVAKRYGKLAANFLAMIQLASMRLWLRAYESTA